MVYRVEYTDEEEGIETYGCCVGKISPEPFVIRVFFCSFEDSMGMDYLFYYLILYYFVNMKKLIFLLSAVGLSLGFNAMAQGTEASWIRQTALSPDGQVIAFTYMGDIYTVPTAGGVATRVTTDPALDKNPVWSTDGQTLAFASNREGAFNVFVTSRQGGVARRVTYNNSVSQVPVAFYDNGTILFEANYRPSHMMGIFPFGHFTQIYKQSVAGGRPELFSATSMKDLSIGADGRILYTDIKGYEDEYRKHHVSPIARDIWQWKPDGKLGTYTKLTTFGGEDRNAIWLPDQSGFLYTSEQDGTFNVYRAAADGSNPVQLTHFKKHPVRFMSADRKGNVAFTWNGKLYYMPLGGKARQLSVQVYADYDISRTEYQTLTRGARYAALSPNEKEIALVIRGEVFVTNIEYGTTKRITNTPEQERNVSFSPDGRKLVYSAERNGQWNIYMSEIVRSGDDQFVYASEIKETQLTDHKDLPSFEPIFSPDGKEIAFLRDRSAIYVLNLDTKAEREVVAKKWNYSYADGDQWFRWSPDSKWIITDYIANGGWNNKDVALFKADGSGEKINLTESGYSDRRAKFVMGGKAVVFGSDRAGYRSHGSWGSESDLYIMFLDQEAYDTFLKDKEERELAKKADEANKSDKSEDKKEEKKEDKKTVEPLELEFKNREYRIARLTRASGSQSDFVMDSKGEKLYYLAYMDNSMNLYAVDLVEKKTEVLVEDAGYGTLSLGKDDKTLYLFGGNGLKKIENNRPKPISYAAKFEYKPSEERAYIYDHVVRQVANKFYDVDIHGVDWQGYADNYRTFLPYINNNVDFAEMLSELLGELNASHTGASAFSGRAVHATASLGLFYDESYQGEGVKIQEVMISSPLDRAKSVAKPGVIIQKVNGETIAADRPIDYYLNGLVGQRILLTMKDTNGKVVEEYVTPMDYRNESSLLYERWVKQRAEMVREWSNGRIGYVHIEGMNSPSYRRVFRELLGKYRDCDAVVVDTRFNGGGWLHGDIANLLSGREYARFVPRGQYIGSEPFTQWYKPSVVLMSEGNYSDAYGTPWTYKTLGIGKLVGTPVAGTMTAVWWETQINPGIVFGIPQVTVKGLDGKALENQTLQPDVLVYNTPEQNLQNHDAQLRAAVDELLRQIGKKK